MPLSGPTIVLATDGGQASRAALRWLSEYVGDSRADVQLVSIVPPGLRGEELVRSREEYRALLARTTLALSTLLAHAVVTTSLLEGDPSQELEQASHGADLLVIGIRSGGSHHSLPVVAAGVANCAVVVVPEHWSATHGPIVVGASIDLASDFALDWAIDYAQRIGGDLVVSHAWELPTVGETRSTGSAETTDIPGHQQEALDRLAAAARGRSVSGTAVTTDLRRGEPAEQLRKAADGASLLVVGRRRRSAIVRLLLGSTSHDLVIDPPCPVAVVPQPREPIPVAPGEPSSSPEE